MFRKDRINAEQEIRKETGLRWYIRTGYTDERICISMTELEGSKHEIELQILLPTSKSKKHKRASITRIERWYEISGIGMMSMAMEITDKTKRTSVKQTDELRKVISIVKKYNK